MRRKKYNFVVTKRIIRRVIIADRKKDLEYLNYLEEWSKRR